jgi:hypothetical protein
MRDPSHGHPAHLPLRDILSRTDPITSGSLHDARPGGNAPNPRRRLRDFYGNILRRGGEVRITLKV